jgi:hypothetical protein
MTTGAALSVIGIALLLFAIFVTLRQMNGHLKTISERFKPCEDGADGGEE